MAWRRAFFACPHGKCHRPFDLPVYFCPNCNAEHKRLIPGSYGVFQRRCRCGELLPTFFLVGRARLEAVCPHCHRPLHKHIGEMQRMDLPLMGGASSGKSTFLLAAMIELENRAADGLFTLKFTNAKHEQSFRESRRLLLEGRRLSKTSETSPDAFQATMTPPSGRPLLLSWYDPAGEIYQGGSAGGHQQNYLHYSRAAVFLIDPFSLPQVREERGTELRAIPVELVSFCEESPEDIYARSLWSMTSHDTGRRATRPLAVVLTKIDVLDIGAEILPDAGAAPDSAGDSDETSQRVRAWLHQHGESNLVSLLEGDFHPVKYFCCRHLCSSSPDGKATPPDTSPAFLPLAWIFAQTRSLQISEDG